MKIHKIVLLVTLAGLFATAGAFGKSWSHNTGRHDSGIRGSGKMTTESRTVDTFNRVESNLAVTMSIVVGKPQSVELTFDDNLIDFIRTDIDGKTLVIESDESFSSESELVIKITVPSLELIRSQGSGDIDIANVDSKRFRVDLSGSGTIRVDGKSDMVDIEINGSGEVNTADLTSGDVTVTINGSGEAMVLANGELDAEINGSGNITYSGKPEAVHSSVNGSGRIKKASK